MSFLYQYQLKQMQSTSWLKQKIIIVIIALIVAGAGIFLPPGIQPAAAQGPGEFEPFQAIPTHGALDWESFTIGSDTYLAVANNYDGSSSNGHPDSKIYKWNGTSFVEFQTILTKGATDWESFTIGSDTYLAVANYSLFSQIYKWNGSSFVEFQAIPTYWARDLESFAIGSDTYLAVAIHENSRINLDSKIYKWDGANFVEFQAIPTYWARDWESFTIGSDTYLALADSYKTQPFDPDPFSAGSTIYKWDGANFVEFQAIPNTTTNSVFDLESFTIGSDTYLAGTQIYKWDGTSFVEFQATGRRTDWEHFTIGSETYLAGDRNILKWDGASFVEFQAIPAILLLNVWDWESFTIGSDTYLAGANFTGLPTLSHNTDSQIYKWRGPNDLLSLYALAFDNLESSPTNLSIYYQETIEEIRQATISDPNKTAVVLADLDGLGDTHILEIRNGVVTATTGLPQLNGAEVVWDANLDEGDMSDRNLLGAFLKWALATYPAGKTTFSYIGHGMPIMPEVDVASTFDMSQPDGYKTHELSIQRYSARPDITDWNSKSIITAFDLAGALELAGLGAATGRQLDVLDVNHCFGASIEEFYELHEYAQFMTGSPSYNYFVPQMIGQALSNITPATMTGQEMAQTIVDAYSDDTLLYPAADNPGLMVVVKSDLLPGLKYAWDGLSTHLMTAFNSDYPATRNAIQAAYSNSQKYDSTFCSPQDWQLAAPDDVDMYDLAGHLLTQFGNQSAIGAAANQSRNFLKQAIVYAQFDDGTPWWPDNPTPWTFKQDAGSGLRIYADFEGTMVDSDPTVHLRLPAMGYYTDTVNFSFIQPDTINSTWADVFKEYWKNQSLKTVACLPQYPVVQNSGDVTGAIISPAGPGFATTGSPVQISIALTTPAKAYNPLVTFRVIQNGQEVFSNMVGTGYLMSGTHQVDASESWIPTATGIFTIEVTLDADNRIFEGAAGEGNNLITLVDQTGVLPSGPFPRPGFTGNVVNNTQWISDDLVNLEFVQDTRSSSAPIQDLLVQVFQFSPGLNPGIQIFQEVDSPTLFETVSLNNFSYPLPVNVLKPGPVILHVWADSLGGRSALPVVIRFNYIPANIPLAENESHYYLLNLNKGDTAEFDLTGNVYTFGWHPFNYARPNYSGGNTLTINNAPFRGEYVLSVKGIANTQYTFSANGPQGLSAQEITNLPDTADFPASRPFFQKPMPKDPGLTSSNPVSIYLPLIVR